MKVKLTSSRFNTTSVIEFSFVEEARIFAWIFDEPKSFKIDPRNDGSYIFRTFYDKMNRLVKNNRDFIGGTSTIGFHVRRLVLDIFDVGDVIPVIFVEYTGNTIYKVKNYNASLKYIGLKVEMI